MVELREGREQCKVQMKPVKLQLKVSFLFELLALSWNLLSLQRNSALKTCMLWECPTTDALLNNVT